MVTEYPYTMKPNAVEDFLKKCPTRPEPKVVNKTYLKAQGYTSSYDLTIAPILKFVGFLDSSNAPTQLFKTFRDTRKSGGVMAQALKDAYKALFELNLNPCGASDTDLENFFSTATGRGGRMLEATVAVFKVLCKFADFAMTPTPAQPAPVPPSITHPTPPIQLPLTKEGGVTLNVSIRLELPATQDAEVYDRIFQSLKRNLLTPPSKED